MSQYSIVAEMVQSNKSENNVWFVRVTGCDNPELQGYCKHAIKAMRLCFSLKARTKFPIDNATLEHLKACYAESERAARWAKLQQIVEAEEPDKVMAEQRLEMQKLQEEQMEVAI